MGLTFTKRTHSFIGCECKPMRKGDYDSLQLLAVVPHLVSMSCLLSYILHRHLKFGRDAIQKVLDKLESRANTNLIKSSKAECKVLHLVHSSPMQT